MIRICSTLQDAGYEVTLIGRKKDRRKSYEFRFKTRRLTFLINKGPLFYALYNLRLFFILLFSKFDIIHSVDLDTLPAAFLVSKIRGKKLVYDSHEYFTEVPELLHRPSVRNIWLKIEAFILPKLENAITVGEKIAEEYENKYDLHFEVIRNMPELKEIEGENQPESKFLIYQGALNKGRGLEALISCMTEVPIQLKIAGKGDIEEELKELCSELKLEHKVEFLGNLLPEELPALTQSAFAGINVSENLGLSYYYSLNNKFFDYVQAGLPAITNEFPEYVALDKRYHCVIFAEPSKESLLKAINLLLNDTALYEELKKNCFLARQHWNWTTEADRLLIYYAKIR
ncbi:glycosyltransferase family 4 protein [bacterium]|nr:glycosyltransferase family 4 protein [bacterium]